MKKFVLTIVCAAVVLPFIVGCGSKKEETVVTPTEETSTTSDVMDNEAELAQAGSEESSDSKENYEA